MKGYFEPSNNSRLSAFHTGFAARLLTQLILVILDRDERTECVDRHMSFADRKVS
jgi:hypothetical protein